MGSGKKRLEANGSQSQFKHIQSKLLEEIRHQNSHDTELYYTAIIEAIRRGDVATLKDNIYHNFEALDTIYDAASRENLHVLDALLQPEKDDLDSVRIIQAIKHGRVNSIRDLTDSGVKLESVRHHGQTVFQNAVIYDSVDSLLEALGTPPKNKTSVSLPNIKIEDEKLQGSHVTDGVVSSFSVFEFHDNVRLLTLQKDADGRNALHTAAMRGHVRAMKLLLNACGWNVDLDVRDNLGDTPLTLAVKEGHSKCVKFLLKHGSNLSLKVKPKMSAMELILKECPRCDEIMERILDLCVAEDGTVDLTVLIPEEADTQLDVVYDMYQYSRKEHQTLLSHPVLECLLSLKWRQFLVLFLVKFVIYLIYTALVTVYVILRTMGYESSLVSAFRLPVCFFSAFVIIISFLFLSATPAHYFKRVGTTILRISSPALSLLYVLSDDMQSKWTQQIGSYAILFCWLLLLMNIDIFPKLSLQAYMFLEISYSMFKYMAIFACVVVAFAFSFFVLFADKEIFTNPWRSLLYTSMILLQGDFDNIPLFDGTTQVDTSDSIVIGLMSLLFLIVSIIGVLNMMVGLAVRGSEEMQSEGYILYQKKQVETLYGLEKMFFFKYLRFCIKPTPRSINVKNESYIDKKLRIRVLNLNKDKNSSLSNKDFQKLYDKIEKLETVLNYLSDYILNSQVSRKGNPETTDL